METKDKKKLEGLLKKYKLPSFKELDDEFEISTIEKKEFFLREIRRKIAEKIEAYGKLFESVLQIEPTIITLNELTAFSESDKEELYKIFRKLMVIDRGSIETSIDENDKKTAEFIKNTCKEWQDLKKELLPFVQKLKKSWMKETKIKEILRYVG
ncbi:hypothetical protein KY331_05375 [Candidatus Woesearchaeota archaeon]|nr:hypothetical protein [Candidatus Woesearchaeota archaeon]